MASGPSQRYEEENMYSSRHEHGLYCYEGLPPYTCSGCKEYGANFGYRCALCPDFILHEACAALPDQYVHPLYGQHPLQFRNGTFLRHHCDGCGEVLRGFVFESRRAHLKLHPLCMALPAVLSYRQHKDHRLRVVIEKEGKYSCSQCGRSNSTWKYQCEEIACKVRVDLNCAKVDFYGLSDHGITSIARRSRSGYVKEKLSKSGKFLAGTVLNGAVSGLVGAEID